ncbi:ABC transporter ATP-binding protein [Microvirga sp. VF16]|uniref:ABC transporter ATP-binding protein n=1 Tax=Microvirga sp. VF16 TaxID=2807101 RepID=UPI00193E15BC|nr:oligopeptide/dipeptide ABC transporter ATP-binding protein [Microvirga sp. VF16]QRM32920.1 ATP-binding cassette domain-containing protein [Microvirga sp. VF16]
MTDDAGKMLLKVSDLKVHFPIKAKSPWQKSGTVKAVDGVSLAIGPGETLGLVGESGCGKSTVARAIIRLNSPTEGAIILDGENIATLRPSALRKRRKKVQMVFQDPASSLDPRMSIASVLAEPMEISGWSRDRINARIDELLGLVGLRPQVKNRFPHEFSGGQKQRIVIARALALSPQLVICDEPVSALDVSVQAQIINLLRDIQRDLGVSYLFVAHDLGVVRQISDRVAVMYLGKIVEHAHKKDLYDSPLHPYTQALLSAVPRPIPGAARNRVILAGDLPTPLDPPSGCRFRTRCPLAQQRCADEEPALIEKLPNHQAACHFAPTAKLMPPT